jgi:hypothetical protein
MLSFFHLNHRLSTLALVWVLQAGLSSICVQDAQAAPFPTPQEEATTSIEQPNTQPAGLYRLQYEIPEGLSSCPSQSDLQREVETLLKYDPFGSQTKDTILVRITPSSKNQLEAQVIILDAQGNQMGERSLKAEDCAKLAEVLALVIAIAIDPFAALPPVPTPTTETTNPIASPPPSSTKEDRLPQQEDEEIRDPAEEEPAQESKESALTSEPPAPEAKEIEKEIPFLDAPVWPNLYAAAFGATVANGLIGLAPAGIMAGSIFFMTFAADALSTAGISISLGFSALPFLMPFLLPLGWAAALAGGFGLGRALGNDTGHSILYGATGVSVGTFTGTVLFGTAGALAGVTAAGLPGLLKQDYFDAALAMTWGGLTGTIIGVTFGATIGPVLGAGFGSLAPGLWPSTLDEASIHHE